LDNEVENLMSPDNSIGEKFVVTLFGESHGKCIGVVIDGVPPGYKIDTSKINEEMARRRPGQSKVTTSRNEADKVEIISGIFDDKTTGAPILILTRNKDVDSSKYDNFKFIPRPGHADYPVMLKYGGFHDYRGSGRFSGRLTAGLVMAGSVARQIMDEATDINIGAHVREIAGILYEGDVSLKGLREKVESSIVRCCDETMSEKMIQRIEEARAEKDSVGGIVECMVEGMPAGLGNPFFNSIESKLSKMMFSVGAIKAIEFGAGFKVARMKGSENNDPYRIREDGKIKMLSNNAGGILGGISTGEPIVFKVAVKPTSSIGKKQDSIDLSTMKNVDLEYEGRHDPCIVPRVVPVIEAATCMVLVDILIGSGLICKKTRD
jgi:chorismate synthase